MSTQLHDSDLDLALARLVAEGVITSDQAAQVGALRDSYAAGHHAEAAAIRSRRGVVALAAVGGVLVAIGAITAVLSAWDSYSDAVQLALAWGATAAAVAAAVVVALRTPDGLPDLRGHERRGRAAVVGTLGLLAAGLAAAATALTMTVADAGGSRPELTVAMACWGAASVVVLVVLAVAPGPMATLPAWACSVGLALTGTALLAPAAGAGQRLAPVDVLLLVVAITLGMAWAVLGPRVARPAQLAEALGVGTWCGAALAAAVSWPEQFTWQERLDECAGLDPLRGATPCPTRGWSSRRACSGASVWPPCCCSSWWVSPCSSSVAGGRGPPAASSRRRRRPRSSPCARSAAPPRSWSPDSCSSG